MRIPKKNFGIVYIWNFNKLVTTCVVNSLVYLCVDVCALANLAFRNPVGVITLGCTCEVQEPSHLLTLTSLLHVRCRRPRSSNSSKKSNQNILFVIIYLGYLKSAICMFFFCEDYASGFCRIVVWNVNTRKTWMKFAFLLCGNQIINCYLLDPEPLRSSNGMCGITIMIVGSNSHVLTL
jgi:hypothetical protein